MMTSIQELIELRVCSNPGPFFVEQAGPWMYEESNADLAFICWLHYTILYDDIPTGVLTNLANFIGSPQ